MEELLSSIVRFWDGRSTCSPLLGAAYGGSVAQVQALLNLGVDPNVKDSLGETPLMKAVRNGHLRVADVLLNAGADARLHRRHTSIQSHSAPHGFTALHWAARDGNEDMVNALLTASADVNGVCTQGATALFFASQEGHLPVVKMLLSRGADVNLADRIGMTALSTAADMGCFGVVEALVRSGADVNAADFKGRTALHLACSNLNGIADFKDAERTVYVLLNCGADETTKTLRPLGKTAMDLLPSKPPGRAKKIRVMLSRARFWRCRGWLVMLRARGVERNACLTKRQTLGGDEKEIEEMELFRQLVDRLCKVTVEGVFRMVLSFM